MINKNTSLLFSFGLSKLSLGSKVDIWQSLPEALSTLVKEGVAFSVLNSMHSDTGDRKKSQEEKIRRTLNILMI